MRDFVNPLLLLIVVALLACSVSGVGSAAVSDAWIPALCVTAFIVNAALAVARAVSRRHALMSVVWSMVYLVVGGCAWVMAGHDAADDEMESFCGLEAAYREGGDPLAADENGDCLFTVAASVGRLRVVQEVLERGAVPADLLVKAACRAAENGRENVLEYLLKSGVAVESAAEGTTLLCAAAQNARRQSVALLLRAGASPDRADAEGTPPLIHAVIADSAPVVQLLLQAGAKVSGTDAAGRDAASYARSNKVAELLSPGSDS